MMEPRMKRFVDDDEGAGQFVNRYSEVISSPEVQEAFKAWISDFHDNSVLAGERETGREEEKTKIAKNLLELGLDTETILKATGLTKEKIDSLR